jgi:hypothetical protein
MLNMYPNYFIILKCKIITFYARKKNLQAKPIFEEYYLYFIQILDYTT